MALSFDQLLGKAKPTESSVELCLAGDLFAKYEELQRKLQSETGPFSTLGNTEKSKIADDIKQVEAEMQASAITFLFRAIPRSKYEVGRKKHEGENGQMADSWFPFLVAESFVSATDSNGDRLESLDVDQVLSLFERLSEGQRDVLVSGAWDANTIGGDIPKSLAASVISQSSEQD